MLVTKKMWRGSSELLPTQTDIAKDGHRIFMW